MIALAIILTGIGFLHPARIFIFALSRYTFRRISCGHWICRAPVRVTRWSSPMLTTPKGALDAGIRGVGLISRRLSPR
ncbi:MAG: hypothetical protein CM15mP74_07250 [Halieaceae bacterium]|nr:MAG: hypothetical protein CM15mP74_07250 [Halieaceae bacterium]